MKTPTIKRNFARTCFIILLCSGSSVQSESYADVYKKFTTTLKTHKYKTSLIAATVGAACYVSYRQYQKYYAKKVHEFKLIKPFFSDTHTIKTITEIMDGIESKGLTYPDYSNRTGMLWSDGWVETKSAKFEECTETIKVTEVDGQLKQHNPQSVVQYSSIQAILSDHIIPKTLDAIRKWATVPATVCTQIFFQRCATSDGMDWHQDPGEDYDSMADYSLVLMLGNQNDPVHGWLGGEFKIRSGNPLDAYDEKNVTTIIPTYNQGVLFNNKLNSHAVTAVTTNLKASKRDIIVIMFHLHNHMPMLSKK